MNRHSLSFQISAFFLFLMILINTLFYFQYRYEQEAIAKNSMKVFNDSQQILRMGHQRRIPIQKIKQELYTISHVELLNPKEAGTFNTGELLAQHPQLKIYAYKSRIYIHFHDRRRGIEHILRFEDKKLYDIKILLMDLLINLAVLAFFFYIIRRIAPLKKLKSSIVEFSKGDLDVHTRVDGKDEIAEVSNEFDRAITTIKQLQGSRNLFLRNIMHELKTPIAKGKLISDLLEDEKNAQRLSKIFKRFEHLLGEFAKIERVTSNELSLNKKKFRVVDIIDNAFDLLMIEQESVNIQLESESEIEVDFELFSIVLKNLIDNALKYGTSKPSIIIKKDSISIVSSGEELESSLFEHVFNRKFEDSSKGLGLGIYISKNIVQKHGFHFEYLHQDSNNIFRITF